MFDLGQCMNGQSNSLLYIQYSIAAKSLHRAIYFTIYTYACLMIIHVTSMNNTD